MQQTSVPRRQVASTPKDLPLAEIIAAIRSVQFGTVQIIVQNGVVVQIDKTEKIRLTDTT